MVKIRLMRKGATKRPAYRVVVADSRSPRDGRFIENIGRYQPLADPSLIEIDEDRALYWLSKGAQPTSQVTNLLRIQGIWEKFEAARPGGGARAKAGAKAKAGTRAKQPGATADQDASGSSES
jgi:small subunit ribosomal protein S16